MKKRILSILLAVIVVCGIPFGTGAVSVTAFTDVKPGAWYYNAVDYATSNGLFSGTSATTFSPETPMDRGMFVTVLGRKANVPNTYGRNQSSPFLDLTQADYYYSYTVWARDNGIVSGVGNGRFAPKNQITREQMATMLYKYARKAGYDVTFTESKFNQFPDYSKVSAYAVDALKWATSHGIVSGMSGKLMPQGMATRAQVAQIFLSFGKMTPKEVEPSNPENPDPENPGPENPGGNWWDNYNPDYPRLTGKSEPDADGGYYDYDLANEIMDLINDMRVQNGTRELLYHPDIQAWAAIRAKEASFNYSHTRPDGSSCDTVGHDIHAENLAGLGYKTVSEQGASAFTSGWYDSLGHRQNLLNPAANLGVVSCYVLNGKTYAAHLFSNRPIYIFDM